MRALAAPFVALELLLDPGGQKQIVAWFWPGKLTILFLCFNGANAWVSRIDALIVMGLLAWLGITRRIAFTRDGLAVAIGLAALYLALPSVWRGGALVDLRAPISAMLILPAFLAADLPSPKRAAILAFAFAAFNIGAVAISLDGVGAAIKTRSSPASTSLARARRC